MKTNLIAYFLESVRRSPERVAVVDKEARYTFQDVAQRAVAIAENIHRETCEKGQVLAVFLPKCALVTFADYGILMTGNAFMNLDVKTPVERIAEILHIVNPPVILTDEKGRLLLEGHCGEAAILDVSNIPVNTDPLPDGAWHFYGHTMIDADPFCIINTSGSTGIPKSVVTPFRAFHNFVLWTIETYQMRTDCEVAASVSPVFFDAFVLELLLMSTIGLTQVLVPDSYRMFPIKMLQLMREEHVSFFLWVPTIMVNIANAGVLEQCPLPDLRVGWFAGEVCPPIQVNQWQRANPQARFANLYGPMEVTVVCTYYDIPGIVDEQTPIPIGKPIDNYDVMLLTEDGQRIEAAGEEGEICVRGSILAYGYYGLADKTESAFRQVPWHSKYAEKVYHTGDFGAYDEQGNICFRGRKDTLIKHSGYRIELAEIEHALLGPANLAKCGCVVYDFKQREIVFFYEAQEELSPAVCRRSLAQYLPKYMLPTRYVRLDALPRGGTGKIDRARLNREVNG